jgi:hypothetical protein
VQVDPVRTHAAVGVGATNEELRRVDARDNFVPTHASLRRFLRQIDKRFARDAPVVEAFAAEVVTLDDRDARAGAANGSGDIVAGGTIADDDQVVVIKELLLVGALCRVAGDGPQGSVREGRRYAAAAGAATIMRLWAPPLASVVAP